MLQSGFGVEWEDVVAARSVRAQDHPSAAIQPKLLFWDVPAIPNTLTKTPPRPGFLRFLLRWLVIRWLVIGVVLVWSLAVLILVAARWIDPPTTAVHMQRRMQSWIHRTPYRERYKFIPLSQISPDLQHAVIAAEDAHFYQHHGFIGTRSESQPKTIWRAIALAELPP